MVAVTPALIWYPTPEPGDIVQCRFPQDKFPQPGPKERPALVMQVDEFIEAGELKVDVTVAYGSSVLSPVRSGHFVLPCTYKQAGLQRDTRFDLTNQCTLPYNSTWFAVAEQGATASSPQRGYLPLDVPTVKKAFIAALSAASNPVNRTSPNPKLGRKK